MIHCINSSMILRAAKVVAQERKEQGISKEEIAWDAHRRNLANNCSIQEYIQKLTHSNIGLI